MSANWWEAAPLAVDKPEAANDEWWQDAPLEEEPAEEPPAPVIREGQLPIPPAEQPLFQTPWQQQPQPLVPDSPLDPYFQPGSIGENDLAAIFGPRDLGPMPTDPGHGRFRELETIEVSAPRPQPDTRPIASWGEVFGAVPETVGGRFGLKGVGAQELVASQDARKKYWQALVLPDAYRRAMKLREAAAKTGADVPNDLWTNDPFVQEAAARAGVRPDTFADYFTVQKLMAMSPQELQAYAEENRALIAEQDARLEQLATERQDIAAELQRIRPNMGSEWSPKALAFDLSTSAPDFAASVGAGLLGGPAVGVGTLGVLTLPEQYATAKNMGMDDAQALFFASAMTAAELVPEMKAMEVLTRSPAGKQFLRSVIGNAAQTRAGQALGAAGAEGASEAITEALQIGIENGVIDEGTSITEALSRIARAGLLGSTMGGTVGAITGPGPELPAEVAAEMHGPLDVPMFDASLRGEADALPPMSPRGLADALAPSSDFVLTQPTPEDLAAVMSQIGAPQREEPYIADPYWSPELPMRDPNIEPELPLGTMQSPATTGSRTPEAGGGKATAPIPPPAQGAASPAPLSSAFGTAEPAAPPAPPAPQEPAPAPAPHAAPAVSTEQEPPAGEAAIPPIEEEAAQSAQSLDALRADPTATVVRYEPDPRGGLTTRDTIPEWTELGNGWAKREFVREVDGQRYPIQEMRNQTGKRFARGFDLEGKPLNVLPVKLAKKFDNAFERAPPEQQTPAAPPAPAAQVEPPSAEPAPVAMPPAQADVPMPAEQPAPPPAKPAKAPKAAKPRVAPPQQGALFGESGEPVAPSAVPAVAKPVTAPAEAGLVGEHSPAARDSLTSLLADPDAHVRKYEPTKTGGWTTTDMGPAWTEMPNGFAARQYINEYAGKRMPVQEIRSPNGGIAQRGIDTQGNPYGTLDVKGIPQFEEFFKRGKTQQPAAPVLPAPKPLDKEATYPKASEGTSVRETVPSGVVELTTTKDKFQEVINEVPALFEAPTHRVVATYPKGPWLSKKEAARRIRSWQEHARKQNEIEYPNGNQDRVLLSLFDFTGNWARPFEEAGYTVIPFDIKSGQDIRELSVEWFMEQLPDIHTVDGILIACPCTDFAVSGSQWWKQKDADGRTEASKELVFQALRTVEYWRPRFWALENPVGRIESLTGLPPARLTFQPNAYGDPYTKMTQLWGKFNADLPLAPVEPTEGSKMHSKYGGKSERTKTARSETPEGFAAAFFMANNYLDASPADRLTSQFPEAAGAIEAALEAGFTEEQIREVVTEPYENYEPQEARDAVKNLVKTGEPAGAPPAEVVGQDEDVGTQAAAPKAKRVKVKQRAATADEMPDEMSLEEDLEGRTGPVPPQMLPGESTPVDPLQIIGARKAQQIAQDIARNREAEVAPKRDTTLGQSAYDTLWRDLHGGMHPGETPEEYAPRHEAFVQRMRNAPVKAQMRWVKQRLKMFFDFKDIEIDPNLQAREALDAMLDAYNNLQTQASLMGQPKEAMGFNGQLTLSIKKKIGRSPGTRGMFSWDFKQGFDASVLSLARRADSFTHEWLHALDLNLLMRFTKRRALGVTGASQLTTQPLPELPKKIHDAFMNVMRAILLTDEASMKRLANLTIDAQNTQVKLTKAREKLRRAQDILNNREAREKKAAEYEAAAAKESDPFLKAGKTRAAEQLRAGNASAEAKVDTLKKQVELLEKKLVDIANEMKHLLTNKASALAQGSRFADFMQGTQYFSIPAELFARAGESWMGNRIGQQAGVEFLAGSPEYYNDSTEDLLKLIYPNEADRTRIFSAFDDLFLALATDQYFEGNTVASKVPQPDRLEKELWLEAQRNAQVNAIRNSMQSAAGDLQALGRLFKKMRNPISAAVKAAIAGKNAVLEAAESFKHFLYLFYTARGRMNGLVEKAKADGNPRLANKIRAIARLLTDDPGSGTEQAESLEQEYQRQAAADLNALGQIAEQHGLDSNNEEQMRQLYEELAKPTAQVRAEIEEYVEFLEEKLAATEGDRNKVRTAEALQFQLAAIKKLLDKYAKPSQAPGNVLNAADKIRKLMDEVYYRQQQAGIDMGYVSNYMFRSLDDEAITENRAGFVEQAKAVYDFELHRKARTLNKELGSLEDRLRVAKSIARNTERGQPEVDAINREMGEVRAQIAALADVDTLRDAQNWLYSAQVADMFQFDRSTPPSNFTKSRKLGPVADILMAEFYDQNPLSNLSQYFPMAARRAAYSRRFGNDHAKYQQMRHELLAHGITPDDLETIDEQVKVVSGMYNAGQSKGLRSFTNGLYNTATMALLPFSLFAQIAEPLSAGIRTGRVRDGFNNMLLTMQQLIRTGNAAEMRQIADIIGLVSSSGTDTIVQNRMFQDVNAKNAKVVNNFYKVTGVHGYTSASRVATMKLAGRYLTSWADKYRASKPGSKERAAAAEELRELGVTNEQMERFVAYVGQQGNMMSINALLRPESAELKQAYVVALHRFVDTVIANPKASDRARMAFNPVGRFVMSISSFSYTFQRHVLTRFGKRLARADNKAKTVAQFVVPFMALMVGQMASRLLREWIQDEERFEKRVADLTADPIRSFFNAVDAAGGTGAFAPLYNWFFKSRYQKEMSTLAMGAAAGFYVDSIQDIYEGFTDEQDPNDNSNAAERRAARSAYRLLVNSIAPRILERMGLSGVLGWAALTFSTSYSTANSFAQLTAPMTPSELERQAQREEREARPKTPALQRMEDMRKRRENERLENKYRKKE